MILYETSRRGILLQVLSDTNQDWWHQPRRTKYTLRLVVNGFEQQYFLQEVNDRHRQYNPTVNAITRMIDWAGQPNVIRELVINVNDSMSGRQTHIPLTDAEAVRASELPQSSEEWRRRWVNQALDNVNEEGYFGGL